MNKNNNNKKFHLEHWKVIALILAAYDIIVVNGAYILALWFRFDCVFSRIPREDIMAWLKFVPFYSVFCLVVFWFLKLYKSLWRFASYAELMRVLEASVITTVFHILFMTFVFRRMPVSYYIIGALIQFVAVLGIRFSYRFVLMIRDRKTKASKSCNVMLIGAGSAGQMILRARLLRDSISRQRL